MEFRKSPPEYCGNLHHPVIREHKKPRTKYPGLKHPLSVIPIKRQHPHANHPIWVFHLLNLFSHPDCYCRFRIYTGSAAIGSSRTSSNRICDRRSPSVGNLSCNAMHHGKHPAPKNSYILYAVIIGFIRCLVNMNDKILSIFHHNIPVTSSLKVQNEPVTPSPKAQNEPVTPSPKVHLELHGQADPALLHVNTEDLHLHDVADAYNLQRMFDEAVGHL